jgi:hypothetical protein
MIKIWYNDMWRGHSSHAIGIETYLIVSMNPYEWIDDHSKKLGNLYKYTQVLTMAHIMRN